MLVGVGSRGSQLHECRRTLQHALQFYRDAEVAMYRSSRRGSSSGTSSSEKYNSDESTDAARVELAVLLLDGRRSSIKALHITLEENYTFIMGCLVSHLLCVRALSEDIEDAISGNLESLQEVLVTSPSNEISAAAAIGTTPLKVTQEVGSGAVNWKVRVRNAASHLFSWLRKHQRSLKRSCRNAEIVKSVDPSVRAWLRDEEYSSPQDIIRSYHQKYAKYLRDMRIPLHSFTHRDREQAVKDLEREAVQLNHRTYIGCDIVQAITSEVAKIVTFHFDLSDESDVPGALGSLNPNVGAVLRERSRSSSFNSPRKNENSVMRMSSDTFELLVSTVLVAASRTIASGDAFFIVQDLYGGEGLILRPSQCSHNINTSISSGSGSSSVSVSGGVNSLTINLTAEEILVQVQEGFDLFLQGGAGGGGGGGGEGGGEGGEGGGEGGEGGGEGGSSAAKARTQPPSRGEPRHECGGRRIDRETS